jgi:hypothetical protein
MTWKGPGPGRRPRLTPEERLGGQQRDVLLLLRERYNSGAGGLGTRDVAALIFGVQPSPSLAERLVRELELSDDDETRAKINLVVAAEMVERYQEEQARKALAALVAADMAYEEDGEFYANEYAPGAAEWVVREED